MGYCPFESRYNGLYRDTGLRRLAWAQPRHGHDTARPHPRHGVAGPRYRPRYGRPARRESGSARAYGLAKGSRDTKIVSWLGGQLLCRNMATIQAAIRRQCPATWSRGAATHPAARDTASQCARGRGLLRYKLV